VTRRHWDAHTIRELATFTSDAPPSLSIGQLNKMRLAMESVISDTLPIPTTISLVNGSPNIENGKKLIDFLLAVEVEKELIGAQFLAHSVRDAEKRVEAMNVDYVEVARRMRHAEEAALTILQGRTQP